MREEWRYILNTAFGPMPEPTEADKSPHPFDIAFLRPDAVMFDADNVSYAIEQPQAADDVAPTCLLDEQGLGNQHGKVLMQFSG